VGSDSLEVAGRADVGLGELLPAFGLLVPPLPPHVVEEERRLLLALEPRSAADLRVLDVHRGHVQSRTYTHTHTHTERHTHRDTQTHRERDTHSHRDTHRHTHTNNFNT